MSGGNSANNSWTILSPEETVAETVRPLEEVTKHHEQAGGPTNQPPQGAASLSGPPNVECKVAEERKEDLSGDSSTDHPSSMPSSVTDDPIPSRHALVQQEAAPVGPDQASFSDSSSHVTPSPDEPPGSPLSTETLGGVELTSEEGRLTREGTRYLQEEEDLRQEGEESDLAPGRVEKHTDSTCLDEEKAKESREQGDSEETKTTLLASLERIGRIDEEEEEEEDEEEFQLPRREDESVFSLNKCILGAVILVGLGTILFSESDYSSRELRDSKEPGKQEWLEPEVPPSPADADHSELLTKLAKGNQQISVLQAQLQAQKEELKAAKGQAAEGETQRMRWEEENSRLKSEMASVPLLQKENERMKRELESLPTLQKELETLRSTVTELKRSAPPSGQSADGQREASPKLGDEQRAEKEKHDRGEWKESKKSEWKEGERKERKDGGKTERKEAKTYEQDKLKEGEGKYKIHKEEKEWKDKDQKKEKASRGDEGKTWKDRGEKKERVEKTERKEWKDDKEWKEEKERKKDKHEKKTKEWGGGKHEGATHKVKDKWNGGKKVKDGFEERGKEKWSGEKKKKDGNWMSNDQKGERKQYDYSKKQVGEKVDRKQGNQNEKGDQDSRKDKKKDEWKRKEDSGEWKDDTKHRDDKFTGYHHHHEEHLWGERKTPPAHHQSSLDQADYWTQQRNRLHRKPKAPQHCVSPEACAQAEGLHPVSFAQFESILQTYLAKAEQAGVDASKREELKKLAAEFFQDGVFMHDQVNFRKFVKNLADILEDMVEGDEEMEEEEGSALEEEMEAFGREAVARFLATGGETHKGEWQKESGRASG
ncbi:pre-B-cell leukemia homeobox interacting protein 1b isoform X2 [Dunckerocampus dactyliophorus]|uniref:pre-B-cell leukemia homeobox interacting protein 1b isoform X2 n=1 Tax=Dunckerocampus dactyliophorus TaxID=161453 RepID=UPI00240651AD|nr:pre-B-cell leukemia homeobox interacting protein 1b isoform X2 [Dunckerocampus dactyliophorus]